MIKAEHAKWARLLFNIYIDRLLRNNFSHFYLANNPPAISHDKSLIVTPNHISWWDGFFIDFVNREFINRKIHLMILESSLRRYSFFKKVGAYSINHENNLSLRETIRYTKKILLDRNNFVVTYPQGEIEAFEKRPLNLKKGLSFLISGNEEMVLPVGFKIQFYNEKNPAVVCRFGDLCEAEHVKNDFNLFKNAFLENLDQLQEDSFSQKFVADLFAK